MQNQTNSWHYPQDSAVSAQHQSIPSNESSNQYYELQSATQHGTSSTSSYQQIYPTYPESQSQYYNNYSDPQQQGQTNTSNSVSHPTLHTQQAQPQPQAQPQTQPPPQTQTQPQTQPLPIQPPAQQLQNQHQQPQQTPPNGQTALHVPPQQQPQRQPPLSHPQMPMYPHQPPQATPQSNTLNNGSAWNSNVHQTQPPNQHLAPDQHPPSYNTNQPYNNSPMQEHHSRPLSSSSAASSNNCSAPQPPIPAQNSYQMNSYPPNQDGYVYNNNNSYHNPNSNYYNQPAYNHMSGYSSGPHMINDGHHRQIGHIGSAVPQHINHQTRDPAIHHPPQHIHQHQVPHSQQSHMAPNQPNHYTMNHHNPTHQGQYANQMSTYQPMHHSQIPYHGQTQQHPQHQQHQIPMHQHQPHQQNQHQQVNHYAPIPQQAPPPSMQKNVGEQRVGTTKRQPRKRNQDPNAPPTRRKRAPKDPNMTKEHKKSGYAKFFSIKQKEYKDKYPEDTPEFGGISTKISAEWRNLSEEEKAPYIKDVSVKRREHLKKKATQQVEELLAMKATTNTDI